MELRLAEPSRSRRLVILYGSQTGTAQEVAERIWRESKWMDFKGPIMPMDEYPVANLIYESLIIFVCSTTGQGEEPDNMKHFWKFLLKKNLPLNSLERLTFGVLGLGDSSYARFNFAAKKLNARLSQLGGVPLLTVGLADDQHDFGASAAIDPWLSNVWHRLEGLYPSIYPLTPADKQALPKPRWHVNVSENKILTQNLKRVVSFPNSTRFKQNSSEISLLANTRTTAATHFQDVRLLEFLAIGINYKPGDVLTVKPRNSPENVERLFKIFSTNKNQVLTQKCVLSAWEISSEMPVPLQLQEPVTLLECAKQHWDLNGVPRRYFFELLAHFTSSELEREKLRHLVSPEGQEELYDYANRPRRTVIEALEDFWHAAENIPPAYLFEVFQPIRARSFSIASSPLAHLNEVHLLVAVVNYKTALHAPRVGLCSNWLASLPVDANITASVHRGSFKFPLNQTTPVVMVGPGTGVAPFRSFIHERVMRGTAAANNLILLFGCRNQAADFHFKDEWLEMVEQKQLTLITAFSRDTQSKIYVQHRIAEHGKMLFEKVWERGGHIFVAGNAKNMPTAVRDAFIYDVLVKNGMELEEANAVIKRFEQTCQYQNETWS